MTEPVNPNDRRNAAPGGLHLSRIKPANLRISCRAQGVRSPRRCVGKGVITRARIDCRDGCGGAGGRVRCAAVSDVSNPFAPPTASLEAPPTLSARHAVGAEEIEAARTALAAHCRDPAARAADLALEGARFGRATVVSAAITGVALLGGGVAIAAGGTEAAVMAGFVAGVAFLILAIFAFADLRVGRRAAATSPEAAITRWFHAARAGKSGYALAALAPTARGQTARAPAAGPNDTEGEPVQLSAKDDMKRYLQGFARPGAGFVRWFQTKKIRVVRQEGDVAVVRADLVLTKWPQWANITTVVLFVVVRLIGIIVGLVLFFSLRKTGKFTIEKTLLRGEDGLWYLLDADLRR